MKKIFRALAHAYLVLFFIFWTVCMAANLYMFGFWETTQLMSPFNISNFIVTMVCLSPYFLFTWLEERSS